MLPTILSCCPQAGEDSDVVIIDPVATASQPVPSLPAAVEKVLAAHDAIGLRALDDASLDNHIVSLIRNNQVINSTPSDFCSFSVVGDLPCTCEVTGVAPHCRGVSLKSFNVLTSHITCNLWLSWRTYHCSKLL